MRIIYEPTGKALEYAPLAVNLYRGCDHACDYCYGPDSTHTTRENFVKPVPKRDALDRLKRDAIALERVGDNREILLSFGCDPYQLLDVELGLTRQALVILLERGLNVAVLTKGGRRSERDFDVFARHKGQVRYGATLTFNDPVAERLHEPGAAPYVPVRLLDDLQWSGSWPSPGRTSWGSRPGPPASRSWTPGRPCVDEFRIGRLNHAPGRGPTDLELRAFCRDAQAYMEALGIRHAFKRSLEAFLREAAW